ncbi:hypothetical protein EPN81_00905 [Patescibacteria group bacterium]|nr:MAG: hypothetical protein EPN81_00905 [Patescibacteria group bacterium]
MKTHDEIVELFGRAAAHKAAGEMEEVDRLFLQTVAEGIPSGVQVVYLYADHDFPLVMVEEASYFDVFHLLFEGQERQAMPVPLLLERDEQLAASLFAAAEFRPREDLDPDQNKVEDDEDEPEPEPRHPGDGRGGDRW